MLSAAEECCEPSGNCQGISHCLESDHPVLLFVFIFRQSECHVRKIQKLRKSNYKNCSK